MALVSVIIPLYNASNYIEKAINSVLSQILEFDLEIICVDDGSIDESVKKIRKLQSKNDNIFLFQQSNSGPAIARNLGLSKVKGMYVVFLDADDYVTSNTYQTLYDYVTNEHCDIVCHGYAKVDPKGTIIRKVSAPEQKFNHGGRCLAYLDHHYFDLSACVAIYRTDFLRNYSLYFPENTNYEDSYFFKNAILLSTNTLIIPNVLYFYVQYEVSRSKIWNISNLIKCCDLYIDYIAALKLSGNDLKMREARSFICLLEAQESEQCKFIFIDYFKQKVPMDAKFIVYGTGSSGMRIAMILHELGIQKIVFCDSKTKCIKSFNDKYLVMPERNILNDTYSDYTILISSCFVGDIVNNLMNLRVKNKVFMPIISDFKKFVTSRQE